MSSTSRKNLLKRIRRGKETRSELVSNNLSEGIAFQISASREMRKWTQTALARECGMSQNNLSRLEDPEYGKHTISSLKRIASVLDVALVVRFVPFSQYIDWLSGTRHVDEGISPESLAVSSFDEEEKSNKLSVYSNVIPFEQSSFEHQVRPIAASNFLGNIYGSPTLTHGAVSYKELGPAFVKTAQAVGGLHHAAS